ncbi:dephospho-CoA kinase [Emticicia sp. 21SJ11W-3]|uniref:dephospho-CoA kinase n=1 Tax=Emticicia sp. 21SJ11W-3 TaxID=2916755 RepID=UPI00209F5FF7|nr:dephospho-CoA kinase [Emticicia sp. 21SJ11W-3]UTA66800.1 dephospho-CoA kinase [Emticicia sp. 21SJ11W-3]
MLKIGITGGIGSGKSIVCRMFEILGVPVYYADERAKWLTNNDLQLRKEIKELLGRNAFDANGQYNRQWVAAQVFDNPALLKMLNGLIHPRVFADTDQWFLQHRQEAYTLREAALMNAAGDNNDFDAVIVVSAPIELRIARTLKRDPQRTTEDIKTIMARQKTDEQFAAIANYTIINDDKHLLIPQVLQLHQSLSRGVLLTE